MGTLAAVLGSVISGRDEGSGACGVAVAVPGSAYWGYMNGSLSGVERPDEVSTALSSDKPRDGVRSKTPAIDCGVASSSGQNHVLMLFWRMRV